MSVLHDLAVVLTFPEGLIWPQLQYNWYAVMTVAWFPFGCFLFVKHWREVSREGY